MDRDGLPIVGSGIDYTKVKPLDQKRLLAFVNHFVSHTAQFLNHFSGVCEERIAKIESQLHRMEVTLNIIEAKLSSIPGMDDIKLADETSPALANQSAPTTTTTQPPQASSDAAPPPPPAAGQAPPTEAPPAPVQSEPDFVKVSQDPRYMRFFKMLNVGVPPPAVKIKMSAECLNPDLLDTPNAPAPPGGAPAGGDDSSESEDAFTDSD